MLGYHLIFFFACLSFKGMFDLLLCWQIHEFDTRLKDLFRPAEDFIHVQGQEDNAASQCSAPT